MGASAQEFENWQKDNKVGPYKPKQAGLEHRYNVEKVSDPEGKHADCRYFVLDPQHDPAAREALELYARVCGNQRLADDLYSWLYEVDDDL